MRTTIQGPRQEWDGMAYIAVHGNVAAIRDMGIGTPMTGCRDALVTLKNPTSEKTCGAIVSTLAQGSEEFIEIDPCLMTDLGAMPGTVLEMNALRPVPATKVSLALSSSELTQREMDSLFATYLNRHPLSPGQKKFMHPFSGGKIAIEVIDVKPSQFAVFSPGTEVHIEEGRRVISEAGLDEVGGLESEKRLIRERILLPIVQPDFFAAHGIRPPRGILLCGPPGCGKTMIARALSSEINANYIELNGSEVFNPLYGESEKVLRDAFRKAREKTPAIILIDELDTLGTARSATRGDLERRLVNTLLTEMDGLRSLGNVIVVATTNTPDTLDPALRRPGRFDYEIRIGVPDRKGRRDILGKLTKHMAITDDVGLDDIARRTHGFVGADLMLLCREAAFDALTSARTMDELASAAPAVTLGLQISRMHFESALKRVRPSALREFAVEVPTNLGWKDVGGLSGVKETIIQEVIQVLKDPESFEQVGIRPVRGVLLYGPPGTGKTLLARIIANEAEANFISVKGPEVLSKWVGESEQRIRQLFGKARESSPCIIFFDEIDSLCAARGRSVSDVGDRVVNQLLTEMDGFATGKHVIVIAATNRSELIDPALLRPGRFDYQIHVPLPDSHGREEVFKVHLASKRCSAEVDAAALARETETFSGAHIEEVTRRAALTAFRENGFRVEGTEISMGHLREAIRIVRESMNDLGPGPIGFADGRGK